MSRSFFLSLIRKLGKIYFSDKKNKEVEYKRTIFYTLKDLGGVYIKFLQVLSLNHDFMKGWGSPKEYSVFNKVQIESINIKSYIEKINNFEYIEENPFACGSFAQLYKGKLKTGEIVAIKILRPSIGTTLKNDLSKLKKMVRLFNRFLPNSVLDYKIAFEEFSQTCLLETDYEREIANMMYFSNLYKNHKYVVIPRVYNDLCSKYVIVQDYIEGPTLADIVSNVKPNESLLNFSYNITGSNIWKQVSIAGGEALCNAITAEYVYGDPHPGNIILLKEDKIAFIDFGIIANKPTSQEAFYLWTKSYYDFLKGDNNYGKLLQTTYTCFCPDIVNALRRCSTNKDFMESVGDAITAKLKNIQKDNQSANNLVQNGHLMKVFTKFLDNKNALNIKFDMNNFQLLKAILAFINSVTMIDEKEGNNQFSKIMIESMKYALEYCDEKGVKNDLPVHTKYNVNESYELLVDTLSFLADGDEYLFENISEGMFL